MTYFEFVKLMLESVGPQAGYLEIDFYEEFQFWMIAVTEEAVVSVEIDEIGRQLVISGIAGVPQEANHSDICQIALAYNHLWSSTGGLVLSLDLETNELTIRAHRTIDGLTLTELASTVNVVADRMLVLRKLMALPPSTARADLDLLSSESVLRL